MSTSLATLVFAVGILGLFYLDRDKNVHTSKALWLPVFWVLISGSRPVTFWLGMDSNVTSAAELIEGSPIDRAIFAAMIAVGLCILLYRFKRLKPLLKKNWPVLLFFFYCLMSVMWSDFPAVAIKRWVKAIGDLVMVFIVVTDSHPTDAIRRVITRTGYILLPVSVLMIKYYGDYGRAYDTWSGEPTNVGVAVTKNMLGVLVFVLSLGALWLVFRLIKDKNQPNRLRHFIAQGTLLAFGISLLSMSHSATSGICFALGGFLIFATSLEPIRRKPATIHLLVLAILIISGLAMGFANESVAHAVGRQSNLTGRTDIWQAVIPLNPNPMIGAGFDSFWLGPRLQTMWNLFPNLFLNEAHNGYIQTYLDLGYVGVFFIALLLLTGYRDAVKSFRNEAAFGPSALLLAYVFTAAIYSITEAGFREMFIIWIFLLLALVGSTQTSTADAKIEPSEVPEPLPLRPAWQQTPISTRSRYGKTI